MENIMEIIMVLCIVVGICVVLPILIVWIVNRRRAHEIDKKSEILMAVLEKHPDLDPAEVMSKLNMPQKKQQSIKQALLEKLLSGSILILIGAVMLFTHIYDIIFMGNKANGIFFGGSMIAIGIAFIIYFFVSKRMLHNEIEKEEKQLDEQ